MGFNTMDKNSSRAPEELFECALDLMRSGKYAPALRCLSERAQGVAGFLSASGPRPEESPALFFNLAICFIQAEDFQSALRELENSLKLIKKITPRRPSLPRLRWKRIKSCGPWKPVNSAFLP
jgi:hypothetical protein